MNSDYYFIKPYDNPNDLPPKESFNDILNETYMHPFTWNARTTRRSFWISTLINIILFFICGSILPIALDSDINTGLKWIDLIVIAIIAIWGVLASLGQTIRRLHDLNYSGYWYWASLFTAGGYFLFYLALQPSVQRPVKWGGYLFIDPNQKGSAYYLQAYNEDTEPIDLTPVSTVGQIIKEHYFDCFNWKARSTRTSFWIGSAVSVIATCCFALFIGLSVALLVIKSPYISIDTGMVILLGVTIVASTIGLIWTLIAQLGHLVRRLHDANFNGAWFWICIVPYIGFLLLDFLLFHPSVNNDNDWDDYLFKHKDQINK